MPLVPLASFPGYWSVQETELLHIFKQQNKNPQTTTTSKPPNSIPTTNLFKLSSISVFSEIQKTVNDLYLRVFLQDKSFYSKVSHSLKLLAANSVCSKLLCLTWLVLTRDLTFCSNSSGYLQLPPVCCTGSCSGPLGSWVFSYQDCG